MYKRIRKQHTIVDNIDVGASKNLSNLYFLERFIQCKNSSFHNTPRRPNYFTRSSKLQTVTFILPLIIIY